MSTQIDIMSQVEDYQIRPADKHEIPLINTLMEKYFHPEETLLKCMLSNGQQDDQLAQIDVDQRRIIEAMLVNFPCLLAIHSPSNEIVGVNVMIASENPYLSDRRSIIDVYETHKPKSELLVEYFRRMNDMIDEAELFNRFPTAKCALELYAVAVSEQHRRKGLATRLMMAALELAKREAVDLVFGLFTSPHSKRSAEKIGMTKVVDLDLLQYRDAKGSRIFLNAVPHHVASVMAVLV